MNEMEVLTSKGYTCLTINVAEGGDTAAAGHDDNSQTVSHNSTNTLISNQNVIGTSSTQTTHQTQTFRLQEDKNLSNSVKPEALQQQGTRLRLTANN